MLEAFGLGLLGASLCFSPVSSPVGSTFPPVSSAPWPASAPAR